MSAKLAAANAPRMPVIGRVLPFLCKPSCTRPSMAHSGQVSSFSGHQYLRQRLVLSVLSGKPVRIDKIRSDDKNPGLQGPFTNRGSCSR